MKTTDQNNNIERRSFFVRLISSAAGFGILGSPIQNFLKTSISWKENISIHAKIHPQAVSRMKKEYDSHGR
jgi:hypothetical protein